MKINFYSFLDRISGFKENLFYSLTEKQRKVTFIAITIFSCLLACYTGIYCFRTHLWSKSEESWSKKAKQEGIWTRDFPKAFTVISKSSQRDSRLIVLDHAIENLSLLCHFPEKYTIENGKLVFDESSEKKDVNEGVIKEFITENVRLINAHPFEELSLRKQEIHNLFFKILSLHDYDRSAITFHGDLERILCPEIPFSHQEVDDKIDSISGKKIHQTLLEAHFSIRLGINLEKIPSINEAYYVLDRFNERLGVLKPAVQQEAMDDKYGASEIREAHLAEEANSVLNEILELRIVPHTELFEYRLPSTTEHRIGSFQFYVKDAVLLYDCLKEGGDLWDADYGQLQERLNTPAVKEMIFQNFEELALFDMLTANNDRHFKNILYLESEGKLIAIDNGNSFPWCHDLDLPLYKMRPLHWFRWRVLPHAQKPFSKQIVDKIKHLQISKIEQCMRRYLVDKRVPSSVESIENKIKIFKQRTAEIQRLTEQNMKISEIAISILNLKDSSL